jgi:hypothetical protein
VVADNSFLPIPGLGVMSYAVTEEISMTSLLDSLDVKVSSQIPLHSLQLARPYVLAKSLLQHGFLNRQPSSVVLEFLVLQVGILA